jgi:hypothetical protein
MKHVISVIFCLLIFIGTSAQPSDTAVVFFDSLTETRLMLPAGAEVNVNPEHGFRKFTASVPVNLLSFYSMKNSEDKPYSWAVMNDFDKDNKYGSFLETEKIGRDDVEGWHRYYQQKDKNGKLYVNCVTLIRGYDYAVYLLESAWSKEQMISPQVVLQSTFRVKTGWKRWAKENETKLMVGFYGMLILPFLLFFFRKHISGVLRHVLCIAGSVLGGVSLSLAMDSLWFILLWVPLFLIYWYLILTAKNWNEVWKHISNILNNIGG